jgi:CHAD domain-containing protein
LGDDPEDVHQFRVATRRLRSDLQTFSRVLDREWVGALRAELRWLGGEVGLVRDADVLTDRLLIALAEAARAPVFATGPDGPDGPADSSAGRLVAEVVHRQWRRLRRAADALPDPPSDADLHRVRILAKRCRYAAEAAVPVVGKPAARFASAVADVQTVLGDHHDAAVAEQWLRAAAAEVADPAAALAAGQLIALQRADNERLRAAWPPAWKAASAKALRRWL